MTTRNLDAVFAPRSVAVIGASNRPLSVGATVMRNLLDGGFSGPILPVNPKYPAVAGVLTYPSVAALPLVPDLAVICTPAPTVPELIDQLGTRGTRGAIVLSAGLGAQGSDGDSLGHAMLHAARPHLLRILGPNCLGLIVPGQALNASFAPGRAQVGGIAFVSQSGALCTAVLDWAGARDIGFSRFVSLGDALDIDFGDVVDDLASDPKTKSILLYIESIRHARKFLSAARAAARNKPIVAIKSGRVAEAARAAYSHTGALAGADDVFEAAMDRAGVLRAYDFEELFSVVETLARAGSVHGDRLAIVTNGGGPGVMAVDALIGGAGRLAEISDETKQTLDNVLPATWSRANPIDIIGDAPPERYTAALEAVLKDPASDAILVLNAPTAMSDSVAAAKAVAEQLASSDKPVFTSWLGGHDAQHARTILSEHGLATYGTPEGAVRGFLHVTRHAALQQLLIETPPNIPEDFTPDVEAARAILRTVRADKRTLLSEPEAKDVLKAFAIPVVETRRAATPVECVEVADDIGYPVAVKILSPDITHKSDVGGVVLDLSGGYAVRGAAEEMLERVAAINPTAKIDGFTVQLMARRPGGYQLIVGLGMDPIFGPFVLFGEGGRAVELIADKAVALPPLNMKLAAELVSGTRISRRLAGYRLTPAIDLDALCLTLIKVAQIAVDLPEVVELDINPLLADQNGVIALDARIVLAEDGVENHLAIRPYPRELEETVKIGSLGDVLLRPIRPEDEARHYAFLDQLTPEDVRFRFFGQIRQLPHSQMARLTQIDYDREMAFIAVGPDGDTLGVVRTMTDPDNHATEFAIVVRSNLKGQGLGGVLMTKMIDYCRARGTRLMEGQVLRENRRMRGFVASLGFEERDIDDEPEVVSVVLDLKERPAIVGTP
jgi:acetyltransferase